MIELFTYRLGRTLKVPMLDPFNAAYRSRVGAVGELVRSVVENWESFRELAAHLPEDLRDSMEEKYLKSELDRPQHMAYMVRKLAEMLSHEEIETLGKQPFLSEARALSRAAFSDSSQTGPESWSKAEQAMKMAYDGFSTIQGRLDLGLAPFPDDRTLSPEDGISVAEEFLSIPPENSLAIC